MRDSAAVVVALAAAAGALAARPLPLPLAVAVVATALVARRPLLLAAGVAIAASGLAARSWAGLAPPEPASVEAVVTLVTDPVDTFGGVRVDARLDGRRVEAFARGAAAGRLAGRLAGERAFVSGHLQPVPPSDRLRLAPRHVSARLTVTSVGDWSPGGPVARVANGLRRTLMAGASSLGPGPRSLYAGFVLGDRRGQPPEVAYDFRASGLAHLLVVSGQNVAFVLAVAGPALRRLGLGGRLAAGAAILVVFGTLTRWEPSVIRAVAMAGVTMLAATAGRPASTARVLALAVGGLLLVDPLLVHSIGFRLSVGACAGIALLGRALTRRIPGPRPLAEALGVTMAAQAGVAPVLVPLFGGLPVAALLANLLAAPAAGPLMMWGLVAGLPAGVVGGTFAAVTHLPTAALVGWVAAVARGGAALPLGQLGMGHVAVLAAGVALAAWAAGRRRRVVLAGGLAAAVVAGVASPALSVARPGIIDGRPVGSGATLWRAGSATVLVLDGAVGDPDRIMSALHLAGVRDLDVLVASRPGGTEARRAEVVQRRYPARLVLAPARARLLGAQVPPAGAVIEVGALTVHVDHAGDRLAVTVTRAGGRGPPG